MKESKCQNCGSTIRSPRPDLRKWCDTCRALKSLKALRAMAHKCLVCESRYYAWDNKSARASQRICADCLGSPAGEHRDDDECKFCRSRDRLIPGVSLCWVCATQADDTVQAERATISIARKLKALAK